MRVKPILTGGSYMKLMEEWQAQVWFDQDASIVRKLGIQAVPARMSQVGKTLLVEELPVKVTPRGVETTFVESERLRALDLDRGDVMTRAGWREGAARTLEERGLQ